MEFVSQRILQVLIRFASGFKCRAWLTLTGLLLTGINRLLSILAMVACVLCLQKTKGTPSDWSAPAGHLQVSRFDSAHMHCRQPQIREKLRDLEILMDVQRYNEVSKGESASKRPLLSSEQAKISRLWPLQLQDIIQTVQCPRMLATAYGGPSLAHKWSASDERITSKHHRSNHRKSDVVSWWSICKDNT